ncbi:MAG: hypothetical protein WAW88_06275, partial [Nocardioides sp.]
HSMSAPRRVLLHVGTPKTGTSHLQDVLFRNRSLLAQHGIRYPATRFDAHFLAALDLLRMPWGGLEREAVGAWDAIAAEARNWPGTTIISHEIFAAASVDQVARARESLGDVELHILISARDLVRQIPAEWQENIKHRHVLKYAEFIKRIQDPARDSRNGAWFWSVQELPAILDRWAAGLPADQVHVITVPPAGAPPDELWSRFTDAFELTGIPLEAAAERANPSLGAPETALIRRINYRFNKQVQPADYRPLVRELLAHQTLSARTSSPRLALPPDVHPWARDLNAQWVEELRSRAYAVHGDLDDLLGSPPAATFADPDRPRPRQVADAALDAIGALLVENARLREAEDTLRAEVRSARTDGRPVRKAAELAVHKLEGSALGRGALAVYRRLRGRRPPG